jgi:hypothetical protein
LAWVSDGVIGELVTEAEYREKGCVPEFDDLPLMVVRRVPVCQAKEPPQSK